MKRIITVNICLALLLAVTALLSLKLGMLEISWAEMVQIFTAPEEYPAMIITELRLPRTLLAILAGAALAAAGVILQKVLHNDLAAPDILGISGGAGCAGLTLLLIFPVYAEYLNGAAFAGALLASSLICLAAWKRGVSPTRLILAGVALGAVFNTASGALILHNSDKLTGVMEFSMGGFASRDMSDVHTTLPFFLAAFAAIVFLPKRLDMLALGEDEAAAFGLRVNCSRLLALSSAALAAATAVSVSGLLGFVGLLAPHIGAKLSGTHRAAPLLISAMLTGAELTLAADLTSRTLFAPRELPCGLLLSGIGAVFFLLLLLKERSFES